MLLACFEIYFGRTIDFDEKNEENDFKVRPTEGRIIRDRFVRSEQLLLLLHPEFNDMEFTPIIQMIETCEDEMDALDDNLKTHHDEKLKFLKGLKAIVEDFCEKEKPGVQAMEDFKFLLEKHAEDEDRRYFIGDMVQNRFLANISQPRVNVYKKKATCWSGIMCNKDLVAFWSDRSSLNEDGFGPKNALFIKQVICQFLGRDSKPIIH